MSNVNLFCFFASYMLVLGFELYRFVKRSEGRRLVMLSFGFAGLAAHTLYIVDRSRQANLPPLLSSTYDWLLVLAWIVVAFYLFLAVSDRDLLVGVFLLPVVQLLLIVAYLSNPPQTLEGRASEAAVQTAVDRWSMLHSTLLVLGITGIILGLMYGMMYRVQHNRLKHHRLLLNSLKLPSLEKLALLNWWSVVLAVPLLTFGLLTGLILSLVRSGQGDADFNWTDPAVLISVSAWCVMAVFFFWLLKTDRPDGKQVASLTIWSCGFLLVTFLVQVMVSSILGGRSFHLPMGRSAPSRPAVVAFQLATQPVLAVRQPHRLSLAPWWACADLVDLNEERETRDHPAARAAADRITQSNTPSVSESLRRGVLSASFAGGFGR